jgi:hypothetical protein
VCTWCGLPSKATVLSIGWDVPPLATGHRSLLYCHTRPEDFRHVTRFSFAPNAMFLLLGWKLPSSPLYISTEAVVLSDQALTPFAMLTNRCRLVEVYALSRDFPLSLLLSSS